MRRDFTSAILRCKRSGSYHVPWVVSAPESWSNYSRTIKLTEHTTPGYEMTSILSSFTRGPSHCTHHTSSFSNGKLHTRRFNEISIAKRPTEHDVVTSQLDTCHASIFSSTARRRMLGQTRLTRTTRSHGAPAGHHTRAQR